MRFAPGQTEAGVTVTVRSDEVAELDEYFLVAFSRPTNARIGGLWGLSLVGILDDD